MRSSHSRGPAPMSVSDSALLGWGIILRLPHNTERMYATAVQQPLVRLDRGYVASSNGRSRLVSINSSSSLR